MIAWSLVMALCLFVVTGGFHTARSFETIGFAATLVTGVVLGWRRRSGLVLAAPLLSLVVAWPAMGVGYLLGDGLMPGLLYGLFSPLLFVLVGPAQVAVLTVGAWLGRLVSRPRVREVEVLDPQRPV